MRRNNDTHLTHALWVLGSYFSEMGGARRPDNISEFEIPLYIAVRVIERYEPRFPSDEYMNERVIEAASPIQSKIDEHLAQLSLSPDEIPGFIRAFYERVNEEMSSKAPPISRWGNLGDYCQINQ